MKSKDAPIGAGLLVLSLLILWHVSSFPPAPGQPYNAALFPGIAAVGLAIASIALIVSGIRQNRQAAPDDTARAGPPAETTKPPAEAGSDTEVVETAAVPSRLLAIFLTAGSIVFYLLVADFLGFVITGTILLAVLMWAYGVRLAVNLPVALITTLVIQLLFYKLLSVPLPWGLLQPIAW